MIKIFQEKLKKIVSNIIKSSGFDILGHWKFDAVTEEYKPMSYGVQWEYMNETYLSCNYGPGII